MAETNAEKQVALVTGASRGIGRAIALALATTGRHVAINYKSREADARAALEEIEKGGGSGELLPFDVADSAAAGAAVAGLIERRGRLDVIVSNAGVRADGLLAWMEPDAWRGVIDASLTGFYNVTRPAIKEMLHKRSGRIVAVSSVSGQMGVAGQMNYCAAKAGLIGAVKSLAKEAAKRGVTVNAVCPGFIETEMLEGLDKGEIKKFVPMQRLGRPEEVAAAVVYLCSDLAGYVTGAEININGGLY